MTCARCIMLRNRLRDLEYELSALRQTLRDDVGPATLSAPTPEPSPPQPAELAAKPVLRSVADYIADHQWSTAKEVARGMDRELQSVRTRISQLWRLGMVRRRYAAEARGVNGARIWEYSISGGDQ